MIENSSATAMLGLEGMAALAVSRRDLNRDTRRVRRLFGSDVTSVAESHVWA